jgi:hypothetical protein
MSRNFVQDRQMTMVEPVEHRPFRTHAASRRTAISRRDAETRRGAAARIPLYTGGAERIVGVLLAAGGSVRDHPHENEAPMSADAIATTATGYQPATAQFLSTMVGLAYEQFDTPWPNG